MIKDQPVPTDELPINEAHPILDAILSVRRRNAADFSDRSQHSGIRGAAKDAAILDCYREVEKVLKERAALSAIPSSAEVERLRDLLDTERYKVAIGVQAVLAAVQGRRWLSEPGRGSYTYDDERYQQEFGAALHEVEEALAPLQAIARDWSDCPTDPLRVAANRRAALTGKDQANG